MLIIKQFFAIVFLILFLGCSSRNNNSNSSKEVKIRKYKEAPQFIRNFMDSISAPEKFLIAEQGEPWEAGCVRFENEPFRQFISGTLSKNQFEMEYMQGGIVSSKNYMLINFGIAGIVSYSVNGQEHKVQ